MPKKGLADIVFIIDRSGSMSGKESDVIGGFNATIEEQRKLPGAARVTLVQFDNQYELDYARRPIAEVAPLDHKSYAPRGSTALLDAVGKTINDLGLQLANEGEADRPERVIVAIITDGQENASKEYTLVRIQEMIKLQQETYSWTFLFLGAGPDAFAQGQQMGIYISGIGRYSDTSKGTQSAYAAVSRGMSSVRSLGELDVDWKSDVK